MASAKADEEPTSAGYVVLNSTSSPQEPEKESQGELQSKCEEAILKLCSICGLDSDGNNNRPFRVVVVGKHGAGKSSFINGVAAALSQNSWHEYAYTGYMGSGAPITIINQRLEKCCNGNRERYKHVLLPTIIDVAGLSDEADDKLEELLRLLFYGQIKEDDPLMKVYEDCKNHTKEEVRELYSEMFPEMRVDRIIFVASSNDALPERLMSCVHRAARPSHHRTERRAVPIYGVMTKKDKVDLQSTAFLEKKKIFMQVLGLNHSRFLVCSNYCDDLDPHGQRVNVLQPDLDLPLLHFMQLVCDRALTVVREDEVLPGTSNKNREDLQNAANAERQQARTQGFAGELALMWQNLNPQYRDITTALMAGLFTLLMAFLFLKSGGNETLSKACSEGIIKDYVYKELLCTRQQSPREQFQQTVLVMFLVTLVTAIVFMYQQGHRRL